MYSLCFLSAFFFFKQKTAYEMRISDWSSDVCSSDLIGHPHRRGAPPEGESYTPGSPNSWAPMSADEDRGLVFVPTGNATPDYYGGHRSALDDRYSSSVIALDAESGSVRWSFQTTHHDLWDYDVPSQPTLVDLPGPKGTIPAQIG